MLSVDFFEQAVWISIPILFGCLGTIYSEKAGMLNLGTEGIMMTSAVFSFLTAYKVFELFSNPYLAAFLGIISAIFFGVLVNLIYGVITIIFKANQTVTGLTLATFGVGIGNFFGQANSEKVLDKSIIYVFRGNAASGNPIPLLSKIPYVGEVFFSQNLLFYLAIILVILSNIYLYKSKYGLYLKAVGDDPASAESVSINVNKYKFIHLMIAGAIISLGGVFFSIGYNNTKWLEDITLGYGWIAVALVIFSSWKPNRAVFGSLLFGVLLLSFTLDANLNLKIIFTSTYLVIILMILISSISLMFKTKIKFIKNKKLINFAVTLLFISLIAMVFSYNYLTLIYVELLVFVLTILVLCVSKPEIALGMSIMAFYMILCLENKEFLKMAPYISTIFVLCFVSLQKRSNNKPPQSLGVPYFREER